LPNGFSVKLSLGMASVAIPIPRNDIGIRLPPGRNYTKPNTLNKFSFGPSQEDQGQKKTVYSIDWSFELPKALTQFLFKKRRMGEEDRRTHYADESMLCVKEIGEEPGPSRSTALKAFYDRLICSIRSPREEYVITNNYLLCLLTIQQLSFVRERPKRCVERTF